MAVAKLNGQLRQRYGSDLDDLMKYVLSTVYFNLEPPQNSGLGAS
jgi:hypothetical protein